MPVVWLYYPGAAIQMQMITLPLLKVPVWKTDATTLIFTIAMAMVFAVASMETEVTRSPYPMGPL